MARLVPAGTPDPDGDRRFAERAFPLLEPLGWVGERHRGGYGVQDPGSVTLALELVFGPRVPDGVTPRLGLSVGRRFVHEFTKSGPDSLRMAIMGGTVGRARRRAHRRLLQACKTPTPHH